MLFLLSLYCYLLVAVGEAVLTKRIMITTTAVIPIIMGVPGPAIIMTMMIITGRTARIDRIAQLDPIGPMSGRLFTSLTGLFTGLTGLLINHLVLVSAAQVSAAQVPDLRRGLERDPPVRGGVSLSEL